MDDIAKAYDIIGMKYAYTDMEDLTNGKYQEYQHYEFICPDWCMCNQDEEYCDTCFKSKEEHVKWFINDYGGNEDESMVQERSSAGVVVHTNAILSIKNNINKYMDELGWVPDLTADNLEEWEKVYEDDDFEDEDTTDEFSKGRRVLIGFALLKIINHNGYMEYDYEW